MSKFKPGDNIRHIGTGNRYAIKEIKDLYYINGFGDHMDMSYTDANFELVEDPKPSTPDEALNKAAEKYSDEHTRYIQIPHSRTEVEYDVDIIDVFKAGAMWAFEQGENKEGEVFDNNEFIKFPDGTYIDLDPTQGLIPAFKLKDGDKVIVQIRKARGDEKKDTIEELVPRNLLTEDQIKEMNGFEYKTDAIKYINSVSNVGLKVSATYYELYNDKNLEDDDNRRES